MNEEPDGPERAPEGRLWLNIAKLVFLVAALVAAWFILDWLIGGK